MKAFVIDVARCNGCMNCQIACKDEHCGTDWLPYAAEQPLTGQFWCKVEEKVRGTVPKTRITYVPHIGGQSDALASAAGDAIVERADGLMYIDPEKAKGRKDLCEFEGVYWNEKLQIPQTCTGCAHLLDDGWEVPRCVDSCPTKALRFGDVADLDLEGAKQLVEGSSVWYRNLPKRFVTGCVVDFDEREVVIGADVKLVSASGNTVAEQKTDEFGDFMFDQVEPAAYQIVYQVPGKDAKTYDADATELDVNIGDVPAA